MWNEYLKKGLFKCGFKQSQIDELVFYKGSLIFLLYVDDGILVALSSEAIDRVIQKI